MHRWYFQRLFRWLIPFFLFIVSLCFIVTRQKASGSGLAFVQDAAYTDLAVARSLVETRTFGLEERDPMPAVRDVLWRVAVAGVSLLTRNGVAAAYILGAVFNLFTILISLRLLRLLFPFPPFIMYSAILLIIAPSLLLTSVGDPSLAMSTALFIAACLLHVEGLSERRTPLPMKSALLVGLLMWMHLEYAIVWIVFCLHAIVVNLLNPDRNVSTAFVVTRGLTGILLLALCVFPLLAWNFTLIQVPWPQVIGAPFVMDAWRSTNPGEAVRTYFSLAGGAMPLAFSKLYAVPFLSGMFERVLVWFGVLFIAGLSIWRPEERPYTLILFVLLLMPACYALVYPYLGWEAAEPVFSVVSPLCVVAASFGIFRVPFLIENLYRKWKEGLPAASGFSIWWIAMGSILLLVGLFRSGFLFRSRMASLADLDSSRNAVSDALRAGTLPGRLVVTDEPGWLVYQHRLPVIDLNGEATPRVLASLDEKGAIDAAELGTFLAEKKPDSIVIWEPRYDFVSSLVPCEPVKGPASAAGRNTPAMCSVKWPDAL